MKNISVAFILTIVYQITTAQYTTPGTSIIWDMDDLVENSDGIITQQQDFYLINEDFTIAELDTIRIESDEIIKIDFEKLVTVNGVLQVLPPTEVIFTALDTTQHFKGFKFDESNASILNKCLVEFGGGIDLLYSDMLIANCIIRKNNKLNSTGAIDLFHSNPGIKNCEIYLNDGPAILSSARAKSSPYIYGNNIYHNNVTNENMPQINLGTSNLDLEIQIINNYIEGLYDQSGGIAITTLAGGNIECLIRGNTIINNRYGITQYGYNIFSVLDSNFIIDNNIQDLPFQGGSGIYFWGDLSNISIVSCNEITGNLWGITNTGNAMPNLGQVVGDSVNIGKNHIYNNGNGGVVFDLYNNTPNDIFAENNHWGTYDLDTIEMNIFHQPDDESLGFVDYLPIKDYITNTNEPNQLVSSDLFVYPNPANNRVYLQINELFKNNLNEVQYLQVFDITGKQQYLEYSNPFVDGIDISMLKQGAYLVKVITKQNIYLSKFIKN